MDVSENRCSFRNGFWLGAGIIKQIKDQRLFLNVAHNNIADAHILNNPATPTCRFKTNPPTGAVKNTVADGNLTNIARHLTSNNHPTVSTQHGTIGDGNIFGRGSPFAPINISPRFYGYTVVSNTDVRIRYPNIATRRGIDAIGIG